MKKLFLLFALVLVSCSTEDETPEENNDLLTSYSQPFLGLGLTEDELLSELGEPDSEFTYDYMTKYTYMSDIPGFHSVEYVIRVDDVHSTEVNFIGNQENLDYIKNYLQSKYGTPEDLITYGGMTGFRYPVKYPMTDLHFSEKGASVIYIEYIDIENPNVD